MKNKRLRIPSDDFKSRDLINEFGGWPRVLHPDFHPSDEFLHRLALAEFSLEEFNELRKHARDLWLFQLAYFLHTSWKQALQNKSWNWMRGSAQRDKLTKSPFDGTARWSDIPPECWAFEDTMQLYDITMEQIDEFIVTSGDLFDPTPWPPRSPGDNPPPLDPARVPKRPFPISGGAEVALPPPEPETENER